MLSKSITIIQGGVQSVAPVLVKDSIEATSDIQGVVSTKSSSLPITTGLVSYFDGAQVNSVTEVGEELVDSWSNEGGQYSLTAPTVSEKPNYDAVNDEVIFDGDDDILKGAIETFTTTGRTVFIVGRNSVTSGIEILGGLYPTGQESNAHLYLLLGFVDGKLTGWYGDGTDYIMLQESTASGHDTNAVFELRGNKLYKNGTELDSSITNYSAQIDEAQLGARGADQFGQSTVTAFVIHKQTLSDADATTQRNYLTTNHT